jgi:hypothetical protein
MVGRPIVHKKRERKMQRTLERELKVPETVVGEAVNRAARGEGSLSGS